MFTAMMTPSTITTAKMMPATMKGVGLLLLKSRRRFSSFCTPNQARKTLPSTLSSGLSAAGVPSAVADQIAHLPPTSALFAAFLGYNPMANLIPANVLHALPMANQANLLGQHFFPNLISPPFLVGLHGAFYLSAGMCFIAACASVLRGKRYVHGQSRPPETPNVELPDGSVETPASAPGD